MSFTLLEGKLRGNSPHPSSCTNERSMNRTERETYITKLEEMQATISHIEKWLGTYGCHCDFNNAQPTLQETREQLKAIKLQKFCIESQIANTLPIMIEGYVGEDNNEVEQNEHGIVQEVYHYLGCPVFPQENSRHYGALLYDKFKDLTDIFRNNTGKFLRVSIEEIPLGEGEDCGKCKNRFKCLTTKVKA